MIRPALLIAALGCGLLACRNAPSDELQRAKDAVFEKKAEQALHHYRLALDALGDDNSPAAQVLRARALRGAADVYYLELRDVRRAAEVYRELIQLCPEAPETLEGRIHLSDILYAYRRDLRGAIGELTAALARNPPQGAELKYRVAKLYFELADYQQAEIEATQLVKRYETSAHVDDAMLLRAQALAMMEGRRAEAGRALLELVERYPDSELQPHALFELGKLRQESGEPDRAIEAWVKALERHPDPKVVQSMISRVRDRLVATTPRQPGDRYSAFDRDRPQVIRAVAREQPKTSVEAAGGTAAEAAKESTMSPEQSGPAPGGREAASPPAH